MTLNAHELLSIFWRRRWLIAIVFVAVTAASIGATRLVAPSYLASTLVIVRQPAAATSAETAKEQVEKVAALGQILETDDVFRAAIERVGLARLNDKRPGASLLSRMLGSFLPQEEDGIAPSPEPIGLMVWQIRNLTRVKTEPEAGAIRITVRFGDRQTAADLANAVAEALIERQLVLSGKPGALDFFKTQKVRSQEQLDKASTELSSFATRSNIYAAEDQKQLLLRRLNEAEIQSASTTSEISQKMGEKQALTDQLRQLRPVTQSPYVSGLVDRLGSPDRDPARRGRVAGEDYVNSDSPPLLLVRVYQEALVELMKLNSRLSGLQGLKQDQQSYIEAIRRDLQQLSQSESEFIRLKAEVASATYNAETSAKRAVEEEITAEMEKSKLTPVRVAQAAIAPLSSAFPSVKLFAFAGAVLGIVMACVAALLAHLRAPGPIRPDRPAAGSHARRDHLGYDERAAA